MKSAAELTSQEVFDSIKAFYDETDVTVEDCTFTDRDQEAISYSTHPAAAYLGWPLLQREIHAFERAKERKAQEALVQSAAGHLALAS